MQNLISLFFRAKHWQIFVLVWGPFVIGITGVGNSRQGTPLYSKVAFVLVVLGLAGWLLSLGTFLNAIVKPALRLNFHFFRIAVVFAAVYLPPFLGSHFTPPAIVAVLMLLLLLIALYCWFYAYSFLAKSLVTAEKGRAVTRTEYLTTKSSFWVGFLGVWSIQPRINRLYAANHAGRADDVSSLA